MAHPEQQEFVKSVKQQHPLSFRGKRVLELGSRNVCGTIRDEFISCDFTGLDCVDGADVDVVCFAHEYGGPDESFDVVCSCEMLEHDPHIEESIDNALRMLKPGGLFFMTCAGEGRQEHGTIATGGEHYGPVGDYYRNITAGDFLRFCNALGNAFSSLYIEHNPGPRDLYFWGIKA